MRTPSLSVWEERSFLTKTITYKHTYMRQYPCKHSDLGLKSE